MTKEYPKLRPWIDKENPKVTKSHFVVIGVTEDSVSFLQSYNSFTTDPQAACRFYSEEDALKRLDIEGPSHNYGELFLVKVHVHYEIACGVEKQSRYRLARIEERKQLQTQLDESVEVLLLETE